MDPKVAELLEKLARIDLKVGLPGERIIELILEVTLEAIKSQPPEVKAEIWRWHVTEVNRVRKWLKLDE